MSDFILVVSTLFGGAWELFQLNVPGFEFSYWDITLAVAFASGALFLVKSAFHSGGASSNGRTTRNPKISEERKSDTR